MDRDLDQGLADERGEEEGAEGDEEVSAGESSEVEERVGDLREVLSTYGRAEQNDDERVLADACIQPLLESGRQSELFGPFEFLELGLTFPGHAGYSSSSGLPKRATRYGGSSPIAVPSPHKNASKKTCR